PTLPARSAPPRARSRWRRRACSPADPRPELGTSRSQLLAHPGGGLRARQQVLGRGGDRRVHLFTIDGLEAELLAEVALRPVGDQEQLTHALAARPLGG